MGCWALIDARNFALQRCASAAHHFTMTDEQTTAALLANDPFAARESADDSVPTESIMDTLAAWDSSEESALYSVKQ